MALIETACEVPEATEPEEGETESQEPPSTVETDGVQAQAEPGGFEGLVMVTFPDGFAPPHTALRLRLVGEIFGQALGCQLMKYIANPFAGHNS